MRASRYFLDFVIAASLAGMVLSNSMLVRGLLVVPIVLSYQFRELLLGFK